MIDFDVMVTWRTPDGRTVNLSATVCYRDGGDSDERRAEVVAEAIRANRIDFPDDLEDDAQVVGVSFTSPA